MNTVINIVALTIILFMCTHQMYSKSILKAFQNTSQIVIVTTFFLLICVILHRTLFFFGELFYINTNYDRDVLSVIKATLNFNVPSWIIITTSIFSFMMLFFNSTDTIIRIFQLNIYATLLAIAFSFLLLQAINIMDCKANKVMTIFSSGGLDPGSAMAGSYFYGYLKIMLPSSGGKERSGLLSAIEKYEGDEIVTIPVKKLFILIPSSSYIPPNLREISNDWLQPAKPLNVICIDRAGVKNRSYHNSVYKLYPKGDTNLKPIYLAVEGATPMKTFFEVQNESHRYAFIYKEFHKEIIKNFYKTLQNLLNENPDCRDYCELVYYEDTINGEYINPANVLLERMKKIK